MCFPEKMRQMETWIMSRSNRKIRGPFISLLVKEKHINMLREI